MENYLCLYIFLDNFFLFIYNEKVFKNKRK